MFLLMYVLNCMYFIDTVMEYILYWMFFSLSYILKCFIFPVLNYSICEMKQDIYFIESECLLTPEESIEIQNAIGADIIMQLDDVVDVRETDYERFKTATYRFGLHFLSPLL